MKKPLTLAQKRANKKACELRWAQNNRDKTRAKGARFRHKSYGGAAPYPAPQNCECCSQPATEAKPLVYDHCHLTLTFRGWVCQQCNVGLGYLGDSPEGMRKALNYIERAYARIREGFKS